MTFSLSFFQNPQYDIKDSTGTLHSGISQTATYYPYDHSLGQYQYDRYVFGFFCRNSTFYMYICMRTDFD